MKKYYTVYDIQPVGEGNTKEMIYMADFTNQIDALQYCTEIRGTSFKLTILETYE